MKKKILIASLVTIFLGLIIGGCRMKEKETLTKHQQDNVVRWIARGYDVQVVELTSFSQDKNTGMYILSFRLNEDVSYETTISVDKLEEFDENNGILGLNPVNRFKNLEKLHPLNENDEIDISNIKIMYLRK